MCCHPSHSTCQTHRCQTLHRSPEFSLLLLPTSFAHPGLSLAQETQSSYGLVYRGSNGMGSRLCFYLTSVNFCQGALLAPDPPLPALPESPALPEFPASPSPPPSEDPDFPHLSGVPSCYLDIREVFNKACATSLPLHLPLISSAFELLQDPLPNLTEEMHIIW